MTTQANMTSTEVAVALFEALNQRDLDRAFALWHPDLVEDFVVIGEFRGRAAARGFFEELFAAVPDFALTVDQVIGDDTHAVVQWHAAGTFTGGPFQGIHATGRSIELRGVDVLHIVDGLLERNTIYYDGLAFARQIGLLPAAQTLGDTAILTAFNAKTDVAKRLSALLSRGHASPP